MKNIFVAIVKEARRINWLEMAVCFGSAVDPHLALRVRLPGIATGWSAERIEVRVRRACPSLCRIDRDRFDPVNRILQNKHITQFDCDFMRQHWVRWRPADVEKKRAARF